MPGGFLYRTAEKGNMNRYAHWAKESSRRLSSAAAKMHRVTLKQYVKLL
jgi:hypothetical protein